MDEESRPATRVGDIAIITGGQTVILTADEQARLDQGEPVLVQTARAMRTPLVGELEQTTGGNEWARRKATQLAPDVDARCVSAVLAELERARIKFPGEEESYTPEQWMLVVVEEVGEVAKAIQDESLARQYEELVQQAAMALRMLIGFSKLNDF